MNMADGFIFAVAEQFLGMLVENADDPVAPPADDGAVGILDQLAILLLTLFQFLVGPFPLNQDAELPGDVHQKVSFFYKKRSIVDLRFFL